MSTEVVGAGHLGKTCVRENLLSTWRATAAARTARAATVAGRAGGIHASKNKPQRFPSAVVPVHVVVRGDLFPVT